MNRTKYIVIDANEEEDTMKYGVRRTWMSAYFEDASANYNDHQHLLNVLSQVSNPAKFEYILIRVEKELDGEVISRRELGGYVIMSQMKSIVLKLGEFTIVDRFEPKLNPTDADNSGFTN